LTKIEQACRLQRLHVCIGIRTELFRCRHSVKRKLSALVPRRDLFRRMIAAAAAATSAVAVEAGMAEPGNRSDKRKARYRVSSAELQEFYRVNRYPAR
jgi:hypothetical protein